MKYRKPVGQRETGEREEISDFMNTDQLEREASAGVPATPRCEVSVVIPALNEVQSVGDVVRGIPRQMLQSLGYVTEVIVVDNGSTDGTGDAARAAGATVVLEPNRGYGRAYKSGYCCARGEFVVSLDADLTYPTHMLADLIRKMDQEGYDFVTTSRKTPAGRGAMGILNRVGNTVLSFLYSQVFGIPLEDFQSGMWIIRRQTLASLNLVSDGMPFSNEVKVKAIQRTKRWLQVPIEYHPRVGNSKLRPWRDGWATLELLFRLRTGRLEAASGDPRRDERRSPLLALLPFARTNDPPGPTANPAPNVK